MVGGCLRAGWLCLRAGWLCRTRACDLGATWFRVRYGYDLDTTRALPGYELDTN